MFTLSRRRLASVIKAPIRARVAEYSAHARLVRSIPEVARTRINKTAVSSRHGVALRRPAAQQVRIREQWHVTSPRTLRTTPVMLSSSSSSTPGVSLSTPTINMDQSAAAGVDQSGLEARSNSSDDQQSGDDSLPQSKTISLWLFAVAAVVFGIVVLGGTTRLTRSGLSMTDWKLHGSLFPLSQEAWEAEFEKYKQFPEYKRINFGLTLDEFKFIFMMEWGHRMAGRLAGLVFGLPYLYFLARGRITGQLARRLGGLLALGGTQGLIGWWMVRSGLEEPDNPYYEPKVSPYRLTTHLASAFVIFSILISTAMRVYPKGAGTLGKLFTRKAVPVRFKRAVQVGTATLAVTILSGAFTAGNRAGLVYNEFPYMGGRWIPQDIIDPSIEPVWKNAFENSTMVQFNHRVLAMSQLGIVIGTYLLSKRFVLHDSAKRAVRVIAFWGSAQVALGITTLLTLVPVPIAAAHQTGALMLLSSYLYLLQTLGSPQTAVAKAGVQAAVKAGFAAPFIFPLSSRTILPERVPSTATVTLMEDDTEEV